ncbi:MAG: hypothetical protein ACRCZY_02940 [Phocaeicola sp.]
MKIAILLILTIIGSATTVYGVADTYFVHHATILNPDIWLSSFLLLGAIVTGIIAIPAYSSAESTSLWVTRFLSFSLINYMLFAGILLLTVWVGSFFFWQYTYYIQELPYTFLNLFLGLENGYIPLALPYLTILVVAAIIKH